MADTKADDQPAAPGRAGADKSQARSERDRRLAEALRANLRRRKVQAKVQAKARAESGADTDAGAGTEARAEAGGQAGDAGVRDGGA